MKRKPCNIRFQTDFLGEKMTKFFVLLLLLIAPPTQIFAAALSNGILTEDCNDKTLIFNSSGQMVGQKIDPFCSGYLQATLETLISLGNKKCTSSGLDDQTPDDLLSIYLTFRKTRNVDDSSPAASTLISAYSRAFDCG